MTVYDKIRGLRLTGSWFRISLLALLLFVAGPLTAQQPAVARPVFNSLSSFAGGPSDIYGLGGQFIENKGQYGKTMAGYEAMGRILYAYEGMTMPVLITEKGLIHLQRKLDKISHAEEERLEKMGLSEEEIEKKKVITDRVITMPIPTNLRPFLTISEGTDFGFFASTLDMVFKLSERNDIPQLAREVRSELKAGMRKDSARLYVMPTIAGIMDWRLFFPNKGTGIARAARFIASMAKHSSTSITFLNFQKLVRKAGSLTVTNARGYVAPSMLGTALFSAVLFSDVLNVHMSYNETQVRDEDAALLKRRFRETALRVAGLNA